MTFSWSVQIVINNKKAINDFKTKPEYFKSNKR